MGIGSADQLIVIIMIKKIISKTAREIRKWEDRPKREREGNDAKNEVVLLHETKMFRNEGRSEAKPYQLSIHPSILSYPILSCTIHATRTHYFGYYCNY